VIWTEENVKNLAQIQMRKQTHYLFHINQQVTMLSKSRKNLNFLIDLSLAKENKNALHLKPTFIHSKNLKRLARARERERERVKMT